MITIRTASACCEKQGIGAWAYSVYNDDGTIYSESLKVHEDDPERIGLMAFVAACTHYANEIAPAKAQVLVGSKEVARKMNELQDNECNDDLWQEAMGWKGRYGELVVFGKDSGGNADEEAMVHEAIDSGRGQCGESDKAEVVVMLKGGLIAEVTIPEELGTIRVRVEDYDTEGTDEQELSPGRTSGEPCVVSHWEKGQ